MNERVSPQDWTDRRRAGWLGALGRSVTGLTLLLAVGGLGIFLLPFSAFNQHALLLHTLAGLPWVVLATVYAVRHVRAWHEAPPTHAKLTGWCAAVMAAACALSGLVLTWEAAFGLRITPAWRMTHIVTTFGMLLFLVPHYATVIAAVARQRRDPQVAVAWRACARHLSASAWVLGLGLLATGALAVLVRPAVFENRFPADYDATAYGVERGPFAPSLARTSTGGAFDAVSLAGSQGCGTSGCHTEIYEEWQPSAHRWASLDAAFQGIQGIMAAQNGPVSTRYCGGCHDPISLFSGTKNIGVADEELTALHGYQEGVSCLVCHAIEQTDVKGNADYVIHQPERYVFELRDDPLSRELNKFLIRAYPARHVETLSKRMFKAPEFCAACHKQFIDEEVNKVGWVQLQNQYDNWKASRWHSEDDPRRTLECRECHMPLVADSADPAAGDAADFNRDAGDGKHRSHRFLGANQFIPVLQQDKIPGGPEHAELIEAWLRGEIGIPEIADRWTTGAAIPIHIEAPAEVAAGASVPLKVHVLNNKAGHDFPTGPLDIIQAWVEVQVTDAAGNVVFHSGEVDPRHMVETGTFMFKAEPVDRYGNLIDRHNLWEMVGVRFKRALFPGSEDVASYAVDCSGMAAEPVAREPKVESLDLPVPPGAAGELHVLARLNYRKVDQYLLNTMFGEDAGVTSPVTVVSEDRAVIRVLPSP